MKFPASFPILIDAAELGLSSDRFGARINHASSIFLSAKELSIMKIAKLSLICLLGLIILMVSTSGAQVTGTWTATGSMSTARYAAPAVLLKSGQVLVSGGNSGTNVLATAELYDPLTGTWLPTGSMKTARSYHTATLLPNGRVLIAGGCTDVNCSAATASAEIYDPATGSWRTAGNMSTLRYFFSATRLQNGNVLVEGGCNQGNCGTVTNTAEIFNSRTGQWSLTGAMSVARDYHTATLVAGGKVLVSGGYTVTGASNNAEMYDPPTGLWTTMAAMTSARALHSATALANGKVMVAGGIVGYLPSAATEVYDPVANKWRATGNLNTKRAEQSSILLPTGKVMVSGGYSYTRPSYFNLASCEIFDAATRAWSFTGNMTIDRDGHSLVVLTNRQVLAVGGLSTTAGVLSSAELYTP